VLWRERQREREGEREREKGQGRAEVAILNRGCPHTQDNIPDKGNSRFKCPE
jgi:hypothetical protein